MGLRGDFDQLAKLSSQLRRGPELKQQILKVVAEEAVTQVMLGFRESRAPDGTPWAQLKRRKGKPLQDTGRLMNSFSGRPTDRGFIIGTNVAYAPFHQYGTKRRASRSATNKKRRGGNLGGGGIPARPMVDDPRNIGPIWGAALREAAEVAFKKFWR